MNTQTSPVKQKAVIMLPPEDEKPMFSEEFVSMVQDRTYETLRAYLEKTKQPQAVQLLDDLIILSTASHGSAEMYIKDRITWEAIGQASHHIVAMGGNWGT